MNGPNGQPVRPEFQALASQHPRARLTGARGEFGDQPGLADPGLTTDEQRGGAALADGLQPVRQRSQLRRPPDEDGTSPTPAHITT